MSSLEPIAMKINIRCANFPAETISAEIIVFPNGNQIEPDDIIFFMKIVEGFC